MRGGLLGKLLKAQQAAVAPTVGLSLFALIGVGGIAFDYARLAAMDSELQNAADQAALAAATQLDGQPNACLRAVNAARTLIANDTRFANDSGGLAVTIANETACDRTGFIRFYENKDRRDTVDPTNSTANFVEITVNSRTANYALTPVVGAFTSGAIAATAYAGVGEAICKNPPVMLCNPDEPIGNLDEDLPYTPIPGIGLKLVTGSATVPGNFGWLEAGLGSGANELAMALGYNNPPGDCQPQSGVTTKPGMTTSVLDSLNTRFDIYDGGNVCPGGAANCSPSLNTRKDLVCSSNSGASCNNSPGWGESADPYRPTSVAPLPTDGSADPDIMGYPRDLCHAVMSSAQTCGVNGTGVWDRDAYFRVNYTWTHAQWTANFPSDVSRYKVYQWEVTNPNPNGFGISVPQPAGANKAAFGQPATGQAGINPLTSPIDRRRIAIAVLNCNALVVKGKTTNAFVAKWLDVFLVEPSINRGGGGPSQFTDKKEVYVEVIGPIELNVNGLNSQVIHRSVPALIE